MPFLSKITTLSFKKESLMSVGGFMFVKNCLLFITFLCMLAGIIMIGAGGYMISAASSAESDVVDLSRSIAIAAIIIGIFITIISFFGCFGAANDKGILLKTYFAMLLILIILEFSVGIAAVARKNDIPNLFEDAWRNSLATDGGKQVLAAQLTFRCCGFRNTTDMVVPADCVSRYNFNTSCFEKVTTSLQNSLGTVAGAGIALAVIELVGVIFSAMMFSKLAKKDNVDQSLLSEAWRINRNKVQYGYQNYQYA